MSRHRVVRHNVHEDRLQQVESDLFDYVRQNGARIGLAAGAIVIVVLGIFLFQNISQGDAKAASLQLLQARTDYDRNQLEPAATKLTQLVQSHGGTPAGKYARLLLGDLELKRGNPAAAETQYREFLGKYGTTDYIRANGQRGLAVALEDQSKFKEAAAAYEQIAKEPVGNEEQARALLDAARAYGLGGDTAAARAAYDRIIKEFGSTRAALTARIHRADLGASAG